MSSKVKGTKGTPSGRKKDLSVSDGTPSTSAVQLPQQQNIPEQSSVDDILKGDDIANLHINPDQLSKLHRQGPVPHVERKLKKVIVKRTRPVSEEHKSVVVLHPLPPNAPVSEVRILGSPNPGPRYDATSTFIPHSVLAPSGSYAAAMYKEDGMMRPPPVVLPEAPPTELKEEMTYQRTIVPRETHALQRWTSSMEDRRLQQSVISKRLLSSPELLAMNQGDGFRSIQEERAAIDRAIHPLDRGKGYRVGSEFWQEQVRIGDDITGIRTTLTKSERGLPPELEFVGTPGFVQKEKGLVSNSSPLYHTWRQSAYLAERRNQLKTTPLAVPGIEGLEVIGRSPWKKQRLRADSLDSCSEEEEDGEEGTRKDSLFSSDKEEERPVSALDLQPDVCRLPTVGPAVRIGSHVVKWEELPDRPCDGDVAEPLVFRVCIEAGLGEMVTSHLLLDNCGTAAIYYSWHHVPMANPHGAVRGYTQRFYFDTRDGVLLPGQCFPFPFTFKSPNAGVFSESWALQTAPLLARGKPLVFVLRGVAFQEDHHVEKRNAIEDMLARRMASEAASEVMRRLVETLCTPPHTPKPVETYDMEEDVFASKNPGLYYHHHLVQRLKNMHDVIMSPPQEGDTPPDSKGSKRVEPKAPGPLKGSSKEKKEATEGKKGKQPTIQEELEDALESHGADIHVEWDLCISSLQEAILCIEDDMVREEKLKELNVIVGSLSFPPPEPKKARLYPIGYEVVCEAVDSLVTISAHLSQVMGVPLREFSSLSKSAEPEQVDSAPSSPVQSSKKDKKPTTKEAKKAAEGKPKGKEKEKVAAAASNLKAKAIPPKKSKGGIKDTDKPEGEVESASTSSEIDPIVVKKYRDALHGAVFEILGAAVDKMALLFEDL